MWTAARTDRRTPRFVRALLLAAVVATVAGLLAMHALSPHGTATDGEHGPLTLPAAHVGHTHALDHAARTGHATGHTDHTGDPGDGHTAMMLCAAFLIAVGALLLSRLRRTPVWWFARSPGLPRRGDPMRLVSRPATGPPAVWAYSVIRC
ncbi:hypothetical protein J2S40_002168 [Nocardioides luteus]|uniref:DUF2946 domain-containing protein n=1 Tax=Nocardioides luteus TaxID=1844 RepID=A0ABQ5SS88_9ACTN|nr:DUF6153 family protein [Nocardioides luteus]MDR7311110.1 hypothetical protein [Nocardioides luteus]GGR62345.1 hypothetical protein GCM10010197_31980 [Nocardioides luteus]GLJ66656.1 hypothetical protein GCM10017579_06920 [Nocardioides luteus]